jgi:hypothetical protein
MSPMDEDRALIAEIAQLALAQAAPDELAVFDDTAEEYFADPQRAVSAANKGQAVGFGLELAMVTPIALAVGSTFVQALISIVSERTLTAGARTVSSQVRRMLRSERPDPQFMLTAEQAGRLRQTALARAQALGLPEPQAVLLAESFVGALWSAG